MNRLDYVATASTSSKLSQRSSWDEDMDSQFFSSFSSGSSSSQDTQSTGIYLFSNADTNCNRKSSLSYRAKSVILHPFKTHSIKTKLKSRIFSKTSNNQQHALDFFPDPNDETADSIKVITRLIQSTFNWEIELYRNISTNWLILCEY